MTLSDKITEGKMHQFDHENIILAEDVKDFISKLKDEFDEIEGGREQWIDDIIDKLAGDALIHGPSIARCTNSEGYSKDMWGKYTLKPKTTDNQGCQNCKEAFIAGFMVSGEGCNGEYPGDKASKEEAERRWNSHNV